MATANQTLHGLHEESHEAFLRWIPIRRHTKETLENLETSLKLRRPVTMVTAAAVGAVVGGILAAPFTFGTSLAVTAAAGAGIGAALGAGTSNLSADEQRIFRLAEVQEAIDSDRTACAEIQELLDSLKRTFTSTISLGATTDAMVRNVTNSFRRASSLADSSVLPKDITQLLKSSPNASKIRSILSNLKCPDETEIQLTEIQLTEIQLTETQSTETQSTEIQSTTARFAHWDKRRFAEWETVDSNHGQTNTQGL